MPGFANEVPTRKELYEEALIAYERSGSLEALKVLATLDLASTIEACCNYVVYEIKQN